MPEHTVCIASYQFLKSRASEALFEFWTNEGIKLVFSVIIIKQFFEAKHLVNRQLTLQVGFVSKMPKCLTVRHQTELKFLPVWSLNYRPKVIAGRAKRFWRCK